MNGVINIKGQIGSDETARGVELVDVIVQAQSIPLDAKQVDIFIDSPGGFKDTGDQIYNFLSSLKAKYKLNTIQTGLIGSIATKLFLVGDNRTRNASFDFVIHNPWAEIGKVDANDAARAAVYLQNSKLDLLNFYVQSTGSSQASIEPLMDQETGLNAEQTKALGFSTDTINQVKVFASVKNKNMSSIEKLLEEIKSFVSPAPAAPVAAPVVAAAKTDIPLSDGTTMTSDAADAGSLVGSSVLMGGAPVVDGDYPTKDGKVLTVAGGKITEVATPEFEAAEPVAARIAALEGQIKTLAESVSVFIQSNTGVKNSLESMVKAEITSLRKDIGVKHVPAVRAFTEKPKLSPIQQKQREIEERKNQAK